jgi:pectin methylesterase-like acyl-CoA thioesterase
LAVEQTASLAPVGNGFTYQGRLTNGGNLANGSHDFTFKLYDDPNVGGQIGSTISPTLVLTNGLFTTTLDFGPGAFDGSARYVQIAVRQSGGGGYTPLTPRQVISPAPYALFAQDVPPYDNVVVVAKSGGDFTSVGAALNSISDNSAANRYLIQIAPGSYTETITMKQYVDIEGSGELITKISYIGSSSSLTGTVVMAGNSELRSLTVENTGGAIDAEAIVVNGTSPSLLHVTAIASGATFINRGIHNNSTSSLKMTDVNAIASGAGTSHNYGVYNRTSSSTTMTRVTATASGGEDNDGVVNDNSSPLMSGVVATASGGSLSNTAVENTSNSAPTMISVTASASGGNVSLGIENSSSPARMMDVIATASGASGTNYGVSNSSSTPEMTNVTASASGAGTSSNYGVYNIISSPRLKSVTATASGGTNARGMYNLFSSPQIQESAIRASGGTNNTGVYNQANSDSYTVTIDNSTVTGSTNAVRNDSAVTTRIGASQLVGGDVLPNGGTVVCADVHDENYALLPHNCLNHSANVVTVAKTGAAFTSVQAALNSITDNSATNRYLVRVGPGVYTETVTMKEYVDIEGAGEKNTTIAQVGSTSFITGTLIGASNTELRFLTVRNTGGNSFATAIFNSGVVSTTTFLHVTASASGASISNYGVSNILSSSPNMNNVTASASSGTGFNYGVSNSNSSPTMNNVTASGSGGTHSYGVNNSNSSPTMNNVTASGSGGTSFNYGVYNSSSSPTMSNVTASASGVASTNYGVINFSSSVTMENSNIGGSGGTNNYGVYNDAPSGTYTVKIGNSTITGATNTIRNDAEFTTRVGATKLDGGPVLPNGGTVTCAGVFDENYVFSASTCP